MNAIDEIYTRDFREVYQPLRGQGVHGETVDRRQGTLVDNIYIERFWRTIKYADVSIKAYEKVVECKKGVGAFIYNYNNVRLHSSFDNKTPSSVYFGYAALKRVA